MRRRTKTALLGIAPPLAAVALVLAVLTASLPRRAGTARIEGLREPVAVELDVHAVARVRGRRLEDVYRAQGFLHAQERFFQMDLARRSAAGELAALFGSRALAVDRDRRAYRFRARAEALWRELGPGERSYVEAYTQGVNAGLEDLGARPPEYWLFGEPPEPWTAADTLLVVFSIYTMLSNNDTYEKAQGLMRASLPPEVYEFLTPSTSRFDRPLVARDSPDPTGGYTALAIPGRAAIDVSGRPIGDFDGDVVAPPLSGAASNQWAIGPGRSKSGRAILANDPHLRLQIPNTFYRIELEWAEGLARGVSIPGVPGVLIGATPAIAWGATVSNADQSDFVVVEVDPGDPARYLTPEGYERFTIASEEIVVAGRRDPEHVEVKVTRWGPVVDEDWQGRPLALHATWLEPDGINLAILDLVAAGSAAEAVEAIGKWAGPALNWVIADASGTLAWTVNGPIPRRSGIDGSAPASWANGRFGWTGTQALPTEFGDAADALFTANNRTLDYEDSLSVSRFWMRPLRAHRISQLLGSAAPLNENDSLSMQLDTRAEGYEFFRQLVLEAVPENEADESLRLARSRIAAWNGRADPDQIGFRILQLYYSALLDAVLTPLLAPAREADPNFVYRWPLADEPLRRILEEQPRHLLAADYENWPALLRDVLRRSLSTVDNDPVRPDASASWGEVNRAAVAHPLAGIPIIGSWLRLDDAPLPGSMLSLRVAAPSYGAVIRMSVSPASHETGILQMPAGQSGHFLSPNFDDLHADWLDGTPTPFLAGATVEAFTLLPVADD